MKKVVIELRSWDHTCGDGCCYDYGTEIFLNGELLEHPLSTKEEFMSGSYIGDDAELSLLAVLSKLGYEVEIKNTY